MIDMVFIDICFFSNNYTEYKEANHLRLCAPGPLFHDLSTAYM